MKISIIPLQIKWVKKWDKNDAFFWMGKSWQCSFRKIVTNERVEIYAWTIVIGCIRIYIGHLEDFE